MMTFRCSTAGLMLAAGLALAPLAASAQAPSPAAAQGYRVPPAPIAQILDAEPTPAASLSRDRKVMAIFGRENLPSIAAVQVRNTAPTRLLL